MEARSTHTHAVDMVPTRAPADVPAGYDDRIPRVFFGLADVFILAVAFFGAWRSAPFIQRSLLPGGALQGVLPAVFPIPEMPTEMFPALGEVLWVLAATAPATLVVIELAGGYRRLLDQSAPRVLATATLAQIVAISFAALIGTALKLSSASRVVMFTYGLVSATGLFGYRGALWMYQVRRLKRGAYAKNVLLVGQARAVEWMVRHFRGSVEQHDFRLAGWLALASTQTYSPERRRSDRARDIPIPKLGDVDQLGDLLVHHPIHEVIAIQGSGDRDWLRPVMEHCAYFRVRLRIVPEALLTSNLSEIGLTFAADALRLPEVVLNPPYLDADSLFVKRMIDIVVSALLIVLLAPLFLLIMIAIKITSPGLPVLYQWHVIGLNGRPFTGYKFTTMVADADHRKQDLLARNEMQGPVFKLQDDPRTTPLGRLLRKFSLNELPQLWSVLRGDMSLVGPRPAFRHELERYQLWHKRKLTVKPGMTCLWQVSGRNRISDFDEWVRLDLDYIAHWSLWLDVRILGRTFWAVVSGSGS